MNRRITAAFAVLVAALIAAAFINLITGTVAVNAGDLFSILFGSNADEVASAVVFGIRIPRICAAVILGGALALSGYMLQTFFDNPIVGPLSWGYRRVQSLRLRLPSSSISQKAESPGRSFSWVLPFSEP